MRLPCRQPGRACLHLLFCLAALFFYNEFLIYYATLLRCSWPSLSPAGATGTAGAARGPLRAMILADTHLLGPFRGHPWDKLRREWQMERSFQTALTLFDPEVSFSAASFTSFSSLSSPLPSFPPLPFSLLFPHPYFLHFPPVGPYPAPFLFFILTSFDPEVKFIEEGLHEVAGPYRR